jgi:hypothetical protein
MIDFGFSRYTLSVCVAIAMLAGCGDAGAGNGVVPTNGGPDHLPNHRSFYYTGAAQHFEVPAGLRQIDVVARGAHGAGSSLSDGGRIHAVIPVTPGEKLVVYVGGDASGTTGGFNGGGGSSGYGRGIGGGGGGATDVREGGTSLSDRIIVSGGGGGAGQNIGTYGGGTGGMGGGKTGGTGGCVPDRSRSGCERLGGYGGGGGTQYEGGQGGAGGSCFTAYGSQGDNGALGVGGNGSGEGSSGGAAPPGGGGGGGYYGGGGGGSGCTYDSCCGAGGGGGGGGSSYAERKATNVRFWQGWKNRARNGLVVFSW